MGTGPGCSPLVWEEGDGGGKGGEHPHVPPPGASSELGHDTPRPLAGHSHGKQPWLRAHIHPMQFYCCLSTRVEPSLRSLPPASAAVKRCPVTPAWDGKSQQHDSSDSMGRDEDFRAPSHSPKTGTHTHRVTITWPRTLGTAQAQQKELQPWHSQPSAQQHPWLCPACPSTEPTLLPRTPRGGSKHSPRGQFPPWGWKCSSGRDENPTGSIFPWWWGFPAVWQRLMVQHHSPKQLHAVPECPRCCALTRGPARAAQHCHTTL